MALELFWTKRASKGYDRTVKYLEENFTDREVKNFVKSSNDFFELLKLYPDLLATSSKMKNVHRGPINNYTILTYRVKPRKKLIELINIRESRKKPLKR